MAGKQGVHEGFGWKCLGQVRLEPPQLPCLVARQTLARTPWEGETQQGAGHEAAAGAPVRASSAEPLQCFPPVSACLGCSIACWARHAQRDEVFSP